MLHFFMYTDNLCQTLSFFKLSRRKSSASTRQVQMWTDLRMLSNVTLYLIVLAAGKDLVYPLLVTHQGLCGLEGLVAEVARRWILFCSGKI